MKFHSNISKEIFALLTAMLVFLMLTGCSKNDVSKANIDIGSSEKDNDTSISEYTDNNNSDSSYQEIKDKCEEIALCCQDLLLNSKTDKSYSLQNADAITQTSIDSIENRLSDSSYAVINSDSTYPGYLENSKGLSEFWSNVSAGKNGTQEIITVSQYKKIYYHLFQYINGQKEYISAAISWDNNNNPVISEIKEESVLDWGMTKIGDFYYQIHPIDRHWDAYNLIRLNPVNHELYDLNLKYILPMGYINNNLFLVNWNSSDYGQLSFNDLFEYLYKYSNGDYFYPNGSDKFGFSNDVYWIPADLFENITLSYFDISQDELRDRALYDTQSNKYPWQEVNVDNVSYFPTLTPEVTKYRYNNDGTFTLTINVMCLDMKADPLFTHEVTIRTDKNNRFKYISNEITYTGDYILPNSTPRLSGWKK